MNWTAPEIFIHASDTQSVEKAKQLAASSGLPYTAEKRDGWRLAVSQHQLQLVRPDAVAVGIDFVEGKATRRASESNFQSQPLARALGLKKWRSLNAVTATETSPRIIDATAGFGTDAWMMASLGCSVTLLEQSLVVSLLIKDAIKQALTNDKRSAIAARLTLIHIDSVQHLKAASTDNADIIYLDPMYPEAKKQALVKKGMQLLHEVIGPDENNPELLKAALNKASFRVIVKRPKGAAQLAGSEDWAGQVTCVESPNTRFDIYHTQSRKF